jgi:hypothetical protein
VGTLRLEDHLAIVPANQVVGTRAGTELITSARVADRPLARLALKPDDDVS